MKNNETFLKGLIGILSVLILAGILFLLSLSFRRPGESEQTEPEDMAETVETGHEGTADETKPTPSLPVFYNEVFELPIIGAAGYTSIAQSLYAEGHEEARLIDVLEPGTPFEVREENGRWWRIRTADQEGWMTHRQAFVNLPDVVPSIIYKHANSQGSLFQSSFVDLPNVTGQAISNMIDHNDRLGESEYIFPVLYSTAQKIAAAQQLALKNGDTLIVYETYRSQANSERVRESLAKLVEEDEAVKAGVTKAPWSIGWFIHSSISNHNRGAAVDLSLGQVNAVEEIRVGDFLAVEVTDYTEYAMHTPMHELSYRSAIFTEPISSRDAEGWREMEINPEATQASVDLKEYMVSAGFTPLASEWWHFNDLAALQDLGVVDPKQPADSQENEAGIGDFDITETLNSPPVWQEVEDGLN
ncbi:hypothetical protein ADIAL_1835 [Alkalibacterium sp. AK22]|uniref:M15 family metallopeptidase n=1 Tax=Alkalibacterium sp. AK22 TaxID=1229520 RepID=UPI0004506295|nr:M15 family metallopeptidase [Alkalibacterium sp. AK22]EXJ22720.1 hypothetical protein ADIAL_1835 [Alkalibacterium sp. AK22]